MSITKGFIATVVATAALCIGLILGGVAPASATTTPGVNATPGNMTSHSWSTDGCSYVPDSGTHSVSGIRARYDFHHACIHHDGCYARHWASRSTCDRWFLNDMNASCSYLHPRSLAYRTACRARASLYYTGVRLFGGPAYSQRTDYAPMNRYA